MMGGLHIEKAALCLNGVLLKNSGWVEMLSESGVFTRGRAESFLVASHITRSRYACQVTAAVLYFLLKRLMPKMKFETILTLMIGVI